MGRRRDFYHVIPSQAQPNIGGQVHEGISRTECNFHPDFIADSGGRFMQHGE
jgi:hypothetical protein